MMTCILLAGEFAAPTVAHAPDKVIAVDGGIRHAQKLAVSVDLWIGDFDSTDSNLQEKYAHIPRLGFSADKGQTDFELALEYLAAHEQSDVLHIIGSGGTESDHAFANLHVLPQSPAPCVLWQAHAVIIAANGAFNVHFSAQKGGKISLFAQTPLHGIRYQGLRWQAPDSPLQPFIALAARNEMTADTAQISWQSGAGLLFLPRHSNILKISQNNKI